MYPGFPRSQFIVSGVAGRMQAINGRESGNNPDSIRHVPSSFSIQMVMVLRTFSKSNAIIKGTRRVTWLEVCRNDALTGPLTSLFLRRPFFAVFLDRGSGRGAALSHVVSA